MAENLGANFTIDITNLKAGLAAANRAIRESESEFKAAAAGMDDWTKSQEGLEKKIQSLDKIIEVQDAKVTALKSEYERLIREGLDPTSAQATNLRTQINNETASLERSKSELERQKTALQTMRDESERAAHETESLTDTVKRQQSELKELKDKYVEARAAQGENSEEAQNLASKIESLSGELRENRTRLQEASDAADDLDHSLEDVDEQADDTTNGGLSSFGVALGNLASNLIQAAISKMKELVTETINVGVAFDSSMSQVGAVSGATGEELDKLREKAKEMGASTKFTASEAADAFNYMAMAGWKSEDMLDGIEGVLNLAAAAGADLATTSDIVTDALTAMGYKASDAGRLADVMAAASSNANTNVEMMGETFKYAAPIVGSMGYSMEDTAVAIGLMANAGIKADQAGTSLRSIITRLAAPVKQSEEAMKQLDISLTDSGGNMKSLETIINELREKFAGMTETEQTEYAKMLAGQQAMSGLLAIVNAAPEDYAKLTNAVANASYSIDDINKTLENSGIQWEKYSDSAWVAKGGIEGLADEIIYNVDKIGTSTDELRDYLESEYDMSAEDAARAIESVTAAMDESEGAAARMAKTMQDNLGGDMTKLGSQFEGVQIALYEKFEPALRAGVAALSKLLDVFNWLIDNGAEVAATITGVATAVGTFLAIINRQAIITAFTTGLTAIKTAFLGVNAVMAANPIGLVISAIAGLVAAFVILWNKSEKFRNFWKGLWAGIKKTAEPIIKAIAEWFSAAWDNIKQTWGAVTAWFSGLWDGIKAVFSAIGEFFGGVFSAAWDGIKAVWETVANWFNDNVVEPIKAFFAPLVEFFTAAWNIIEELAEGCWNAIKAIWSAVFNWYKSHVIDPLTKFFTAAFSIIKQLAEGCWNLIKAVWSVVADWFKTKIIDPIAQLFTVLWDEIKKAAQATWDGIKAVWNVVANWFNTYIIIPVSNFFTGLWNGIKSAAAAAWDGIKAVWNVVSGWFNDKIILPIKNWFTGMWDNVKSGASAAWDGIKSVFGGVADWFKDKFSTAWQKVKDVFSTGGQVFDGIKEGITSTFTTVVNAIIRGINKVIAIPFNAINSMLDKIQNISIAGVEPFSGLVSRLPVPEIPELAKGGVLRKGQTGFLEGDGDEAVVPLERNTGWINKLAARLTENLGGIADTDDIAAAIKAAAATIAQNLRETITAGAQTISGAVSNIDLQQSTAPETSAAARTAVRTITAGSAADAAQRFGSDSGWMDALADKLADKIGGGVTINQTNNYAQAHSRYEIYKSKQAAAAAVKLALAAR